VRDEDGLPVVAGQRFDHDGTAEEGERLRGLRGAVHEDPLRHRDAGRGEQLLGDLLVAGDVHSDGRGLPGAGRPHQLAAAAVTKLQQRDVREPAHRDVALTGRAGQLGGAHAQPRLLVERGDALQAGGGIGDAARGGLAGEVQGQREQLLGHRVPGPFVIRAFEDQPEPSRRSGPQGPAEVDLTADQVRELESHVLDDVPEVRAAGHLADQPAGARRRAVVFGQPGKQVQHPRGEAGHLGGFPAGELLQIDQRADRWVGAVNVRAA